MPEDEAMLLGDAITLNVEDHCLRALRIQGGRVQWWTETALPPRAIQKGLVLDVPAVSAAIRASLAAQYEDLSQLLVSLSGHGCVTHMLTISTEHEQLSHAVLQQAQRELADDLGALYLSWQVLQQENGRQRVLLLGVSRQVLDAQVRALIAAGLCPQALNPKPLALARAISHPQAMIANLEPGTADIVVVTDRVPAITRSLSLEDVEGNHQLLDRLADGVQQVIAEYNQAHVEKPLPPKAELFVSGSVMELPAVRAQLASRLERRCRLPDIALETPPDFPLTRLLVNVGLALKAPL